MKFVAALSLLLILVAVFSVALAQNKEETKSQYGMAFPLEDSASMNSEQRISIIGSVPGEGSQSTPDSTTESPVTTTLSPTTEESPATVNVLPLDSDKKFEEVDNVNDNNPTFLIANDDDGDEDNANKSIENLDEKTNPRLVFIERLMGLHLSAPLGGQQGEKEVEDNSASDNGSPIPLRTPFDKVNAKWATRMRKFSIPLMQQQQQLQADQPNPLLRYAAAAMMTRLLAAAARAHNNEPMMAKDKDDDSDDETVPVLVAKMRSNGFNGLERGPLSRPIAPMYGRPMPIRPPIMRPPMAPPMNFGPPQARMASANEQHRVYSAPIMSIQPKAPVMPMQRPFPPYQQVLILLAHVPMQSMQQPMQHMQSPVQVAESRMGPIGVSPIAVNPYYNAPQQHVMPIHPQIPYSPQYSASMAYSQPQRQVMPVEVPVHVPYQMPVASYHRPVYQSPYQGGVSYQRQVAPTRPVIEIPIEIPIPVHVPVPVSVQSNRLQGQEHDHDQSASEADQVAIVYYDPEGQDSPNDHEDHLEPHTSESHENVFHASPNQKAYSYARPLPDTQSATKMKLWREYIGAKQALHSGVRYIPVAVANDDSQSHAGHDSHINQEQSDIAESQHQPAFVILADDGADAPQRH